MSAVEQCRHDGQFSALHDVEIDDALIDPTQWRGVRLDGDPLAACAFPGVRARFGLLAPMEDGAPANSNIASPTLFEPPIAPRRLSRVVRIAASRRPEPSNARYPESPPQPATPPVAPRKAQPLPSPKGVEWGTGRQRPVGRAANFRLDRNGRGLAVAMMILAWAGVLVIGGYIATTPKSGTKIEWR